VIDALVFSDLKNAKKITGEKIRLKDIASLLTSKKGKIVAISVWADQGIPSYRQPELRAVLAQLDWDGVQGEILPGNDANFADNVHVANAEPDAVEVVAVAVEDGKTMERVKAGIEAVCDIKSALSTAKASHVDPVVAVDETLQNALITKCGDVNTPDVFKTMPLDAALSEIGSDKHKQAIEKVRGAFLAIVDDDDKENKAIYRDLKTLLPFFSFNGIFTQRINNANFIKSSGIFLVDIDKLKGDIYAHKDIISALPECVFCFISPSGAGLKAGIRIDPDAIKNDAYFKHAYLQIEAYFLKEGFVVDPACKDVRRACFVSCDPAIYINYNAKVFVISDVVVEIPKPKAKPEPRQRTDNNVDAIIIERISKMILGATAGNRHMIRFNTGRLLGGFIAGGLIDEQKATDIINQLSDLIADGGFTSKGEGKTIYDGIENGKQSPLYRVNSEQRTYTQYNAEPRLRHEKPGAEQPAPTHNHTLDNEAKYCKVDLLQYVSDKHLLKRMAIHIAAQTYLPVNTVFMMGLSVYASMSCRSFSVLYQNGRSLPIGINLVDEQPPGTGKSWCLSDFQEPFMQIFFQIAEDFKRRISLLQKKGDSKTDEETDELKFLQSKRYPPFITNTTSAGLDITLPSTNGFFSCVSSEQGLLDTLLGISYNTGSNDNDIILNGFDGGYVGSSRAGREPYNGVVVGSVVCFAQEGSIEKILGQSNGTGLAERFLFLAEQHMLGTRDHTQVVDSNDALMAEYAAACSFAFDVLETPKHYKDITNLTISKSGHYAIALYRNEIEPHLADGGKFSHISLRGAASKCNMQIMKIAANLHLLDGGSTQSEIADHHVKSAIQIANELLEANLALCIDKGIIGVRAEFKSILSLFENSSNARTERNILSVKRKSLPFKDFTGDKANLIRDTLAEMVEQRLLIKFTKDGKAMYEPAQ